MTENGKQATKACTTTGRELLIRWKDIPLALSAVFERSQADLPDPLVSVRPVCRGLLRLRAVRLEQLADGLFRGLEPEIAQEERLSGRLLLHAENFLRRLAVTCRLSGCTLRTIYSGCCCRTTFEVVAFLGWSEVCAARFGMREDIPSLMSRRLPSRGFSDMVIAMIFASGEAKSTYAKLEGEGPIYWFAMNDMGVSM